MIWTIFNVVWGLVGLPIAIMWIGLAMDPRGSAATNGKSVLRLIRDFSAFTVIWWVVWTFAFWLHIRN